MQIVPFCRPVQCRPSIVSRVAVVGDRDDPAPPCVPSSGQREPGVQLGGSGQRPGAAAWRAAQHGADAGAMTGWEPATSHAAAVLAPRVPELVTGHVKTVPPELAFISSRSTTTVGVCHWG